MATATGLHTAEALLIANASMGRAELSSNSMLQARRRCCTISPTERTEQTHMAGSFGTRLGTCTARPIRVAISALSNALTAAELSSRLSHPGSSLSYTASTGPMADTLWEHCFVMQQ